MLNKNEIYKHDEVSSPSLKYVQPCMNINLKELLKSLRRIA